MEWSRAVFPDQHGDGGLVVVVAVVVVVVVVAAAAAAVFQSFIPECRILGSESL